MYKQELFSWLVHIICGTWCCAHGAMWALEILVQQSEIYKQ